MAGVNKYWGLVSHHQISLAYPHGTVHSRSQSFRGNKGSAALSWPQRKYQDNPRPNMCSSNYDGCSNREYARVIKVQSGHIR